ncbi:MAG: hypothetical protein H0W73_03990 [Bacteroidetes bacterium]|nr:hypothetical protein [Bacteroidota bacterium]
MDLEKINLELRSQIVNFTNALKEISRQNLKSVILYGGVAKLDYSIGKSNVNILFVFESVDLTTLDKIAVLFQRGIAEFKLAPFILTDSEVKPSSDVFAVKLFDIKQHHILLYGADVLKDLQFDRTHLQFLAGQELRNQLARMKFFYIQNFNLPEALHKRVQSGFTGLVINANTFLYLKNGAYYGTRKEIVEQLLKEPNIDTVSLSELLSFKESSIPPSAEEIKIFYDRLMIQYKQLIKLFKQLELNG